MPHSPSNMLVLKTPTKPWISVADHMEVEFGWKAKLWVGMQFDAEHRQELMDRGAAFYAHEDALLTKRPALPTKHVWASVDAEMIDGLASFEPIFHEMTNRWTVDPNSVLYKSKSQYYNRMIEVWNNIIKGYEIDLVITPSVPHRIFDFACYIVCLYKNIPFLMFDRVSSVSEDTADREKQFYVLNHIDRRTDHIYEAFERRMGNIVLSNGVDRHFNQMLKSYESVKPIYIREKEDAEKNLNEKFQIKNYIPQLAKIFINYMQPSKRNREFTKKITFPNYFLDSCLVRNPTYLEANFHHLHVLGETKKAMNLYQQNISKLQTDKKYVIFAASRQPERSTCPDAGLFYDHAEVLRVLAGAIPSDWLIYYKEHPSNFRIPHTADLQRTEHFYKDILARSPNVRLLSPSEDPFILIDHAQLVATTTGSMGWEALVRNKSTMIFGSVWYENLPGVTRVRTSQDVKDAVNQSQDPKFSPSKYAIEFAQHMVDTCHDLHWLNSPTFGCDNMSMSDETFSRRVMEVANAYLKGYQRLQGKK